MTVLRRCRKPLFIEHLEHRRLLACVVDNFTDSPVGGFFTLRECVQLNNQGGVPDGRVEFGSGNHTIELDSTNGEIAISRDIIIMDMPPAPEGDFARGGIDITIDGGDETRIFNVESSVDNAVLSGLMLTGGNGASSAKYSSTSGGAIRNYGGLTLTNVVVSGNSASSEGGGVFGESGSSLTVIDSMISGNSARDGGGIAQTAGVLTATDSMFASNTALQTGGAIRLSGNFSAEIQTSTITNNRATGESIIGDKGSIVGGNPNDGRGGGVYATDGGNLNVTLSTISGNSVTSVQNGSSSSGGGIYASNGADVTLSSTSVSNNYSEYGNGAGLATRGFPNFSGQSRMTVTDSTISANSVGSIFGSGAGIDVVNGRLDVFQSTISGNISGDEGSAIEVFVDPFYQGGNTILSATLDRVTVTENTSGLFAAGFLGNAGADVSISNSILSDNVTSLGPSGDLGGGMTPDVEFSLVELDNTGQVTNGIDGNVLGIAANLGPLTDNGGPTLTHAPIAGDVTINAARFGDGVFDLDQRSHGPRNVSGRMDMGAFEFGAVPTEPADTNGDGTANCGDINALAAAVATMTYSPEFDLDADGGVSENDILTWLIYAGARPEHGPATGGRPFLQGDTDLNGIVDAFDFITWNENRFSAALYCQGDFNGSGAADAVDFIIWNGNKFQSADNAGNLAGNLTTERMYRPTSYDARVSTERYIANDHRGDYSSQLIAFAGNRNEIASPAMSIQRVPHHNDKIRIGRLAGHTDEYAHSLQDLIFADVNSFSDIL